MLDDAISLSHTHTLYLSLSLSELHTQLPLDGDPLTKYMPQHH